MAKTAVGLFENSELASEVVLDLVANGFFKNDVRVLGEPREMAGGGLMSTPHRSGVDSGSDRVRGRRSRRGRLRSRNPARKGHGLCHRCGRQGSGGTEIMNRHGTVEIEKISAGRLELPNAGQGEELPVHDPSVQTVRFRSPGSGARLFVW